MSQIQYEYTPDTEVIMLLIPISYSDTIWIHPGHGGHSITHLEFKVKIQYGDTPRHGSHSITHSDFNNQIQIRYAPDTEAILFLIQI